MSDLHDTAGPGWAPAAPAPDRAPQPDRGPDREPPPVTGDPAVDEAVARLGDLDAVPLDEQPAVLDAVHRALQDRLADVEG